MSDYTFSRFTDDRLSDVLELQRHHWGPDMVLNEQYFEWKYRLNPYAQEPDIYLAHADGVAVGMQGAYGTSWVSGAGTDLPEARGKGDMIVHPDHRRRGISERLVDFMIADLRAQGQRAIIATSTTQIARNGMSRSGWVAVDPIHLYRRECRDRSRHSTLAYTESALRNVAGRLGRNSDRDPRHAAGLGDVVDDVSIAIGSISKDPRPEAMAAIAETSTLGGGWGHLKDQRFFEWRFANPMAQFGFIYLDSPVTTAYLVFAQHRASTSPTLRLVDWDAVDADSLATVLDQASPLFAQFTSEVALCRSLRPFRRVGFYDASRRPMLGRPVHLLWYPLDTSIDLPVRSSGWDWRDIYSDNF